MITGTRTVVCAANCLDGKIVLGIRHFDLFMIQQIKSLYVNGWNPEVKIWDQGFVDQYGVFMGRKEALIVATKANQINTRRPKTQPLNKLFSEDSY